MTGAFPALVSAVKAALAADPPVSTAIFVNRRRAVAADQNTSVVVRLGTADPELGALHGGPVDWETNLAVECYGRGAGDEAVLQVVHDMVAMTWSRLMADGTLGGLAMGLEAGRMEWDFENTGEFLACQIMNFTVLHNTAGQTLESQTP